MKNDGDTAQRCRWCEAVAVRKQGRLWLCAKHYRFQQMRAVAQRTQKAVPTYDVLAAILLNLGDNRRCPVCERQMNWLGVDGQATVLTLQHDRDGTIRFLCRSCNTRHAAYPNDEFYSLPPAYKRCPGCEQVLPYAEFTKDRRRWDEKTTYCKECKYARHTAWIKQNRDRYNRYQRDWRAVHSNAS